MTSPRAWPPAALALIAMACQGRVPAAPDARADATADVADVAARDATAGVDAAGRDASFDGAGGDARLDDGADAAPTAVDLPDLTVDRVRLYASIALQTQVFRAADCELAEACVAAAGARTLLRFDTVTPNLGAADLVLGPPANDPRFVYSSCHMHVHFTGFAEYRLRDARGRVVATGHKQAFCAQDSIPAVPAVPDAAPAPRYDCENQGIQRGWSDVYGRTLPCQWIDVTGVPDGSYVLEVTVNPDRRFAEARYDNNTATLPVTLAGGQVASP